MEMDHWTNSCIYIHITNLKLTPSTICLHSEIIIDENGLNINYIGFCHVSFSMSRTNRTRVHCTCTLCIVHRAQYVLRKYTIRLHMNASCSAQMMRIRIDLDNVIDWCPIDSYSTVSLCKYIRYKYMSIVYADESIIKIFRKYCEMIRFYRLIYLKYT